MEIEEKVLKERIDNREYKVNNIPSMDIADTEIDNNVIASNLYYDYYNTNYKGFKGFIKRVMRKLCKPIVLPLVEMQNTFNKEAYKIMKQQQAKIEELEERIEELEQ